MEQGAVHELVAGYALDALDERTQREFEAHLRHCARCREELSSLGEVAGMLAYGVEPAAPPAWLRERIVERAVAERSKVVPLRPRWSYPLAAAAAVAACAAVGVGFWATSLSRSLDRERQKSAVIDYGARAVPLQGARGRLLVSSGGKAALALADVPPAGSRKTYEIWVVRKKGAKPVPAGLFAGGKANEVVAVEQRVPTGAQVMVTRERAGGVDAPTGPKILATQV